MAIETERSSATSRTEKIWHLRYRSYRLANRRKVVPRWCTKAKAHRVPREDCLGCPCERVPMEAATCFATWSRSHVPTRSGCMPQDLIMTRAVAIPSKQLKTATGDLSTRACRGCCGGKGGKAACDCRLKHLGMLRARGRDWVWPR